MLRSLAPELRPLEQFDEEAEEFGDDFLSDKDPSILHFLLASGDEVHTYHHTWPLTWACKRTNRSQGKHKNSLFACAVQITSKQLRDDLMTMLIAGHETTAAVLTWTLHCLAGRPDVLKRVQQEVSGLLTFGVSSQETEHKSKRELSAHVRICMRAD